jgi:nitrile hydratase
MTTRYAPGDAVQVRDEERPGHIRTPDYVKGKLGTITALLGEYRNPEELAYGGDGFPKKPLYKVSFSQAELWNDYEGSASDTLYIDIYDHWLEPTGEEE